MFISEIVHTEDSFLLKLYYKFNFATEPILPYALAFAAGAMIFVVVEELIPDSQSGNNTDLATLSLMIGFTIMMILDVALG